MGIDLVGSALPAGAAQVRVSVATLADNDVYAVSQLPAVFHTPDGAAIEAVTGDDGSFAPITVADPATLLAGYHLDLDVELPAGDFALVTELVDTEGATVADAQVAVVTVTAPADPGAPTTTESPGPDTTPAAPGSPDTTAPGSTDTTAPVPTAPATTAPSGGGGSATTQPVTSAPATSQPVTGQPGTGQPGTGQPGTSAPTTTGPTTTPTTAPRPTPTTAAGSPVTTAAPGTTAPATPGTTAPVTTVPRATTATSTVPSSPVSTVAPGTTTPSAPVTTQPVTTTPAPPPDVSGPWRLDSASPRAGSTAGGERITLQGHFPTTVPVYVWFGTLAIALGTSTTGTSIDVVCAGSAHGRGGRPVGALHHHHQPRAHPVGGLHLRGRARLEPRHHRAGPGHHGPRYHVTGGSGHDGSGDDGPPRRPTPPPACRPPPSRPGWAT